MSLTETCFYLRLYGILRRPQNFAKSSHYFWLTLHRTKVMWIIRKHLWPSQNVWTLKRKIHYFTMIYHFAGHQTQFCVPEHKPSVYIYLGCKTLTCSCTWKHKAIQKNKTKQKNIGKGIQVQPILYAISLSNFLIRFPPSTSDVWLKLLCLHRALSSCQL